ncbi:hypothetical protein [Spirosoma panaciterrae]|uniref:hypothetical protein n=1 Tax=Spirosoma panaciterrae TaxID=496058 RepID=UPI00036E41B5|nr:hypothetical protein [Spirosoma panaciterrae]
MGVNSTNIRLGLIATDLIAGFKISSQASSNFTSQLQNDFKRIGSFSQSAIAPIKGISSGLKDITATGSDFKTLASTLGGFFAAEKIVGFGNAIISTSGKFEKFQAVLQNSLGSRSGANQNLNMLSDFAAETPNSLEELTGSFIKFINRGIVPTRQQLTNLGDLAASQGKGFDQLTEAVLDAQSGEFERLKEFGVRASKSGDQVTLSFKGVTQTVKNTSEEITNAIYKFGQLGGVAGSMAAVSQTLEGKISNLGDTFNRLLVALGNGGISAVFKDVIDLSQKFLGVVTDLIANSPAEDLQKQKNELNGLVGAIALANDNETVRLSLITQLNQKYPEFLGQLNAESVTTDILTTRLAAANVQYEKKIRIALGQQAIKKATDDLTESIKSQEGALQQLATASGKSITELEKLSAADRIALARKIAASQPQQNLGMGVYGGGSFSALATVLEQAGRKQATAQAELNRLTGENAARQADLTKSTVSGYLQQIGLIREKIRLHQIDTKLGESEIKRLQDQIRIAEGKPSDMPKALAITPKSAKTGPKPLPADNMSVFKRYEADLVKQIEAIGGDSPELTKKQAQLESIRSVIADLQALTSKNQKTEIKGLAEIVSPNANEKLKAALVSIVQISAVSPFMFAKTGAKDFLDNVQQAKPSLEFIRAKIDEIRTTIAALAINKQMIPPELIERLKQFKELLKLGMDSASKADAMTQPGEGNDEKWIKKAQDRIDKMKAAGQEVKTTAEELGQQMKGAAMGLAQASFGALEAIGTAIGSGTNPIKAAIQNLTDILGNYLIQQGKALAMAALFEQAAALAAGPFAGLLALPTGFQLAASAVLIGGGAAIKALGVKDFAGGGLFRGEQIIRVGENARALSGGGEFVAPVALGAQLIAGDIMKRLNLSTDTNPRMNSDLVQRFANVGARQPQVMVMGEFVARGSELMAVLEHTSTSNYYTGGPSIQFNR